MHGILETYKNSILYYVGNNNLCQLTLECQFPFAPFPVYAIVMCMT